MKRVISNVFPFVALVVVLVLAIQSTSVSSQAQQQTPAAGAAQPAQDAPAGAPPQRGAGGGGRGGARGTPLGDGPWDIGEGENRVHVTVVTKGVDHPWGMVFLPNSDMLVTERAGRLRVVRKGVLDPTPITGLPPLRAGGFGGLMDIALHPNFAQNRLVYFTYAKQTSETPAKSTTAVYRARFDGGAELTDGKDVFVAEPYYAVGRGAETPVRCCGQGPLDASYGSRLAFDKAGYLYITVGDRNYGEMAQDPSVDIGKIVRIKDDGTIPTDNPFIGKAGYRPELYTIGHRNPLGLTIDSVTGMIWSTEFGPRGGDELNRIEAGKNYGWILITNGTHYQNINTPAQIGKNNVAGYEDPVVFWVPQCANPCSFNPGNVTVYHGDKFPQWNGNVLLGSMGNLEGDRNFVLRVVVDANGKFVSQTRILTGLGQRIRDVRTGPDGYVYILTDETAGAMLRLEPAK
jgi:aldose sugar dehydrogenase